MVEKFQDAQEKVWEYITHLKEFGNPCTCIKENQTSDNQFDTIDYTGDAPSVSRWCLDCGGYREVV